MNNVLRGNTNNMAISSLQAAKKVCDLSGWTITHLKLQKMLYIFHLLYLGEKQEPLIKDEEFEAWTFGPVLPRLYDKMKLFKDRQITYIFFDIGLDVKIPELIFLEEKYPELSRKSPWDLVLMTHLKGGAWEKHFDEDQKSKIISNSDIADEYESFYGKR